MSDSESSTSDISEELEILLLQVAANLGVDDERKREHLKIRWSTVLGKKFCRTVDDLSTIVASPTIWASVQLEPRAKAEIESELDYYKHELKQEKNHIVAKSEPLPPAPRHNIFFTSYMRLARKGKNIKHSDLWDLPQEVTSKYQYDNFQKRWKEEAKKKNPSLSRVLFSCYWKSFLNIFFFLILQTACYFGISVILPYMIQWIKDPTEEYYWGYVYSAIATATSLFGSLFWYRAIWSGNVLAIKIRGALMTALYDRVFTGEVVSLGQFVNLFAQDASLMFFYIPYIIPALVTPITLIVSIVLLGLQVGYFALVTLAIIVIFAPMTIYAGKLMGNLRFLMQEKTDERLKLSSELINGIRIVKYYVWESSVADRIKASRNKELTKLRQTTFWRAFTQTVPNIAPALSMALTFLFYGFFSGVRLTATVAYTSYSLMNLIRFPFNLLAAAGNLIFTLIASLKRIEKALLVPDRTSYIEENSSLGIRISDANFKWDTADHTTLSNINLKVRKGDCTIAVGAVGSGKSSLIMSVLGEIPKLSGSVKLLGSLAYVPQQAWIFNGTVRDNILLGSPFDQQKYERVVYCSGLVTDFTQFSNGDATEIGARGVNLSGGQKQRISIARALYSDRDIYLFDDPFSALDAHVGKHVFDNAVVDYLKDKTVLLTTNQLHFLEKATHIVVLDKGNIDAQGEYFELAKTNKNFKHLLEMYGAKTKKDKKKEEDSSSSSSDHSSGKNGKSPKKSMKNDNLVKKNPTQRKPIVARPKKTEEEEELPLVHVETDQPQSSKGSLIQVEDKQTGLIPGRIYAYWISAGGYGWFAFMILCYLGVVALRVGSSWWLSQWIAAMTIAEMKAASNITVNGTLVDTSVDISYWVWSYFGFGIGEAVVFATTILVGYGIHAIGASRQIHAQLINVLTYAVTAFYDKTPVGRILTRLSLDMGLVDMFLPIILSSFLSIVFGVVASIVSLVFGVWYVIPLIVPIAIILYGFQIFYRKTNIEIQRMEASSGAPPISTMTSVIEGIHSIRAFKQEPQFQQKIFTQLDYNNTEKYALRFGYVWFGLAVEYIGGVFVALVFFGISLARNYYSIDASFAGVALSFMAGMVPQLSFANLTFTDIEVRMNSVERMWEFNKIEREKIEDPAALEAPENWPQQGKILFQDFSFRYRSGPMVLKNLNLTVKPKHKVGIVGRTGSGKSSLLQALFRMEEPNSGCIKIDGVDTSKISLSQLRRSLSIIPQDPVLFIGTVRYNLDPFDEKTDEELWTALRRVELEEYVKKMDGGLLGKVEADGKNFSVGQRQLICMARALLKNSPILLLDEATASVDVETDMLIQRTVRSEFKDRTVLTIAHRLNTIMDSDKVLVLDRGNVMEYDSPDNLIKKGGIFASMVQASGLLKDKK
eukprot:TRINITY_DN1865_c0_g2_i1.p1 TRINITY_DN1865_c0_g2~~TRINITY_DN1865_c0_g2_i1.p1  ORF type:complete len:1412 (-),score=393.26 TRINITY_DN1865_c0_g2_i1:115-4284(-)